MTQSSSPVRARTARGAPVVRCLAGTGTVLALVAGCGGGSGGGDAGAASSAPGPAALPQSDDPVTLDPGDFTTTIDNPYLPLTPGTRWTYREVDGRGETSDVVVTVSSATREMADGVTARVVRDTVSQGGQVVEDTFDWYAQDSAGTVWYLGEDTAEFEGGAVTSRAGSFEAGAGGALPGVVMPAAPVAGTTYRQEYLRGEAEDNGAVLALGQMVETPQGRYDDAVLTADTSGLEPDVLEYKLYAPGVGLVLTLDVSGGSGREELLDVGTVSAAVARAAGTTPLGRPYG